MGSSTPTHYERLGVTPRASTEELRSAYRALAQRMHPDRMGHASPAERALAERRMREINESWSVLSDPAKRRAYDDERLAPSRTHPPARAPARREAERELVDVAPPMTIAQAGLLRHLPWVVLAVVFGLIFVLTAYAGSQDDAPTSGLARSAEVGDCLDVAGPTTTVVSCGGPHELEIVDRVDAPTGCPEGSKVWKLNQEGRYDCVVET